MKQFNLLLAVLAFFLTTNQTIAQQGTLNYQIVVNDSKGPKGNLPIVLIETSTFARKEFKTSASGQLTLALSEGKEWMMNVGGMKNYALLTVPQGTGSGSATISYNVKRWNKINQPPVDRSKLTLQEVPQTINGRDMPGAGNSIIQIIAVNDKDRPWPGIEVKLTCFELNKSFIAKTDGKGIARFNVPNNNSYQIDLDGENDFEYIEVGDRSTIRGLTLTYEKINFSENRDDEGYLVQKFSVEPTPVSNRVMVTLYVQGGPNGGRNEEIFLDQTYSNERYAGKTDDEGKIVFLLPKKRSYLVSFPFHKNAQLLDLTRFRGIGYMQSSVRYSPDPRLQYPENYLPSASTLKEYDINSLLNKRFADTDDDELVNVSVKWGNNKINSGSKEALLELGFSIKQDKIVNRDLSPLNLCFVLDHSGSMGGESIEILKAAMHKFIGKLRPIDKVSIVFFESTSVVAYPSAAPNTGKLTDLINAAQATGGTNIYDGLVMGYDQVSASYNPKGVNRVILLTDGYGSKPVDFILDESKKYFEKGIAVSGIGIGTGSNQALLSLLSKYSGGFEHQVIGAEGIPQALEEEYHSFTNPLATNLRVTVKYNHRIIYKTLYGVPEAKNTNNSVVFELDNVFATLNRMALLKFKIENPSRDIEKDKITIQVNYFDEQKQKEVEVVKETNLEWTDETDMEMIYDEQLKTTYSIAVINQALKSIADLCDAKNFEGAKKNVQTTLKALRKVSGDKYSAELKPFIDELELYLEALNRAIKNKG
ncbi:MAG: VWA domain-containing protein [Crocinitomix sp.]|nr:VWA domain-containing protein [Crocinitomix sp.]